MTSPKEPGRYRAEAQPMTRVPVFRPAGPRLDVASLGPPCMLGTLSSFSGNICYTFVIAKPLRRLLTFIIRASLVVCPAGWRFFLFMFVNEGVCMTMVRAGKA